MCNEGAHGFQGGALKLCDIHPGIKWCEIMVLWDYDLTRGGGISL